ncbi:MULTISPECIES: 50S ribosomal protein L21 [Inquilinus]|jgi:large subunit ribosomal protein L21|uniref:Large ribosomal subunit protein bL21 n=1 Tax=Inquilinus ginsengisoli TaxID=363840 RepID=A0ABU1K1Z8_9PROT|nr:50S ribosomal protein L21 [Inquilinus ginsengisoli]MDR6294537.1 large subunit ribosomal protein L21 [Inquilinus ginsengisoli]HMG49380.1 50S ribosomal protein L21 [Inquilinus sp.]
MFAVIRTGGKQYRVAPEQLVTVERLDAEPGASITLDEVLMLGGGETAIQIGTPIIAGASVTAEVVEQTRGPKIIIFKKKRRQNYRRKKGHRQDLTVLKITAIAGA